MIEKYSALLMIAFVLLGTFLESPDNFSGRERCFTRQDFTPKCCVGLSSQIRQTCNTMTLQRLHSKFWDIIDCIMPSFTVGK